jgi:hypothetical protein
MSVPKCMQLSRPFNNKMTTHTLLVFCKVPLDKTCNVQFLCHYLSNVQLHVNLRFQKENNVLSLLFKIYKAFQCNNPFSLSGSKNDTLAKHTRTSLRS